MKCIACFLLACSAMAGADPDLTVTHSGPRTFANGPTVIQSDPGHVYTATFSPPLIYRIHNATNPGWSVILQAAAPSYADSALSQWRYMAGTGQITPFGRTYQNLGFHSDQTLSGDLANGGVTVLSTRTGTGQGIGNYTYTLGSFQFSVPDLGPAGNYDTTLTVTISSQP